MTSWDVGDPEPDESVLAVRDLIDDDDSDGCSPHWGRTYSREWKGYKGGNSRYLSWQELLRRWGPVVE